jgi:hypothetical protein
MKGAVVVLLANGSVQAVYPGNTNLDNLLASGYVPTVITALPDGRVAIGLTKS